jgi:hypothetical protein
VPIRFWADADTPLTLPAAAGRQVELPMPAPGPYFVWALAGELSQSTSYPAEAVALVKPDGKVDGRDMARSSEFWKNDAMLYLLFVREFFDKSGDGEGDLAGAIEKLPWIKRLGVNALGRERDLRGHRLFERFAHDLSTDRARPQDRRGRHGHDERTGADRVGDRREAGPPASMLERLFLDGAISRRVPRGTIARSPCFSVRS